MMILMYLVILLFWGSCDWCSSSCASCEELKVGDTEDESIGYGNDNQSSYGGSKKFFSFFKHIWFASGGDHQYAGNGETDEGQSATDVEQIFDDHG